jgi:hypothetical protein
MFNIFGVFGVFGKQTNKNLKKQVATSKTAGQYDRVMMPQKETRKETNNDTNNEAQETQKLDKNETSQKPLDGLVSLVRLRNININKIVGLSILSALTLSIVYLGMVDSFFLIKNINVFYPKGSYLSKEDTNKFVSYLEKSHLEVIAKNQFWFASDATLTSYAKEVNPNISKVTITNKAWPSTIDITIETKPILATLKVNNEKWRISQNGQFITKDDANQNEKLVTIKNPSIWNKADYDIKNFNLNYLNGQMERFYFISYLRDKISNSNLQTNEIFIETVDDSQVEFVTTSNTSLLFDYKTTNPYSMESKIENTLGNQKVYSMIYNNKLKYIDFRVSGNVFLAPKS